MAKGRKTYPREYRERLVEMHRAGRSAESLAKDFEPTAQSIRNWVKQADLDEGRRQDGLTGPAAPRRTFSVMLRGLLNLMFCGLREPMLTGYPAESGS